MLETNDNPLLFRRSRIDIMAHILENCYENTTKMRLMHKCNLDFSQLNLFGGCLVEAGFLRGSRRNGGIETFETTDKGKEFLRDYESIKRILDRAGRVKL